MLKRICVNCNTEFYSYPSLKRKLCSNKCRFEWQRGRKRISKRIGWNLPTMNNLKKNKKLEEVYGEEKAKEIRENMSKAHKGKPSGRKGKPFTKEAIEKMRIAKLGKKQSESQIKKIIYSRKKFYENLKIEIFCPVCNKKMIISKIRKNKRIFCSTKCARAKQIIPFKDVSTEVKIQNFLKQLGIEHLTHFLVNEIQHKYRCDIFIPIQERVSQKTIIECDGDYFHANPKFYSEEELNRKQIGQQERDKIRTKELEEKGFRVIRLWENEIKVMDLNYFQNKIINNIQIN